MACCQWELLAENYEKFKLFHCLYSVRTSLSDIRLLFCELIRHYALSLPEIKMCADRRTNGRLNRTFFTFNFPGMSKFCLRLCLVLIIFLNSTCSASFTLQPNFSFEVNACNDGNKLFLINYNKLFLQKPRTTFGCTRKLCMDGWHTFILAFKKSLFVIFPLFLIMYRICTKSIVYEMYNFNPTK